MSNTDLYALFDLPRPAAHSRGPWTSHGLENGTPAGAILITDASGGTVAWATGAHGATDWPDASGSGPEPQTARNAALIAAAPTMLKVVLQVAESMPCVLTALRVSGQQPPMELLTAVVLAQQLAKDMRP